MATRHLHHRPQQHPQHAQPLSHSHQRRRPLPPLRPLHLQDDRTHALQPDRVLFRSAVGDRSVQSAVAAQPVSVGWDASESDVAGYDAAADVADADVEPDCQCDGVGGTGDGDGESDGEGEGEEGV